jgi:heme/copper-type cytochrome/quinol oxidase subunit 1
MAPAATSMTLIRGELAMPGLQFLSTEQYNQLFTMHGTAMLLLYATPILFGFAVLTMLIAGSWADGQGGGVDAEVAAWPVTRGL